MAAPVDRYLSVSTIDGVLVLRPQGVLDADCVGLLHEALRGDRSTPAVIDLSDCTLIDPTILAQVDPRRWGRIAAHVCVACGRSTARRLLRQAGVSKNLAVFRGVADALQARTITEPPLGYGWLQP